MTPGDATALAGAIRAGQMTASQAMEASLAAAALWHERQLGAIVALRPDLGRRAAAAFDGLEVGAPSRRAPFGGVPTLAKDLGGPFAGLPVAAGSRLFPRGKDGPQGELGARFAAAGLCPFGLTTSPEFGLSLASEPAIALPARNPLNLDLSAGGSSGGAAAAVAAGIVAIAHATDAGGSIRVPAAACGLIGLKPGRGVVPAGPGFGNHLGGIASELAICRSIRDAAAILAAVSGDARGPCPPAVSLPAPDGALRIGVLVDTGGRWPTETARQEAVEAAGLALERRGHRLIPVDWPALASLAEDSARIFRTIVAVNLAELVDRLSLDLPQAEPLTRAVVEMGRSLPATGLWEALSRMVLISHALWSLFDRFDCLLTPMLAGAPRPVGWLPTDTGDVARHFEAMSAFAPLAPLANIGGCPALTLCFGADDNGLPLPVQLMAPMGREPLLLALGALLEAEGRWQHPFALAEACPA